jgi:alanine dehydrogenase
MTLLLSRQQVASLLTLTDCIGAVESAFRLQGEGKLQPAGILGVPALGGAFHLKAAVLPGARQWFAAKVNGNFSDNPSRFGRPAIQGVIVLCDAENGEPLAVMDSIEITILRTAAATAVAAKHLARPDSRAVAICGCGNQGRAQLRALASVLRLERAFAFDADPRCTAKFVSEMSGQLGLQIEAAPDIATAAFRSDVIVTCTPSRLPFLRPEHVRPGTFIAAVGADSPEKQELDPALLAHGKVVVDVLEQCAEIGELHHALEASLMRREEVYAEIGELAAGKKPGRTSAEEVTVFDSTGTALLDVAAAAAVYENAVRLGRGQWIDLA